MADLRISDLVTASQLKNDDYYEISQSESGTRVSYKATLLAIAVQIATMVDFTSDLNTTSKKITGAINELKNLISLIPQFSIEVVETLPTEDISDTTIYLVPAEDPETGNYYEEYIHVNNAWELVGTTAVDLSDYYTKAQADGKFAVTITNMISPTTTTKKVADIKQNNVTTPVYADDADKVLRTAFGEHEVTGNPVSFDAFLGLEVPSVAEVSFSPIQDLHGYDYPWVGGAGKNKIPLTVAHLKTVNTLGSWSGNSYTYNGITYTLNLDEGGNVKSVTIKGTASADSGLTIIPYGTDAFSSYLVNGSSYKINGCEGGSSSTYSILAQANGSWYRNISGDTSFTYTSGGADRIGINIANGYQCPTDGIAIYPMIRLSTVTDTTFAPYSNICPISGRDSVALTRTGKNLVEITKTGSITSNGITFTVNNDGTITANGTATATSVFLLKQAQDFGKDLQPNTEYIISSGYGNNNVWFGFYYDDNQTLGVTIYSDGERTFTTISDFNYVRFAIRIGRGETLNNVTFKPMVRLSTISDSTFEPYQGHTYASTFGQTVYGGKVDFTTGKLTIDKAIVTYDGTESWYEHASGRFYVNGKPSGIDISKIGQNDLFKCNTRSYIANQTGYGAYIFYGSAGLYCSKKEANETLSDFTTALGTTNMQVTYPLATPIEITLTPQEIELLKGQNVLLTDGDNVKFVYSADIKAYIDSKLA